MKLSQEITKIFESKETKLTLEKILNRLSNKSFGVLLIILSLPSALPVPAPGYSTPFGLALFFVALRMISGYKTPWFPRPLLMKEIPNNKNSRLIKGVTSFLAFFENFLKPRFTNLYRNNLYQILIAFFVLLASVSMILPIPLTNTGPALGVFFLGLSMLEEDFVFSLLGIITVIAGIALTLSVLFVLLFLGSQIPDSTSKLLEIIF